MRANDATIATVNQRVVARVGADPRIHIVPLDKASREYDFKTDAGAKVVGTPDGKVLSNLMFEGPDLLFPNDWRGGLQGLDGLHPTLVGYALMAQQILNAIELCEGVVAPCIDLIAARRADTLLQEPPQSWDFVLHASLDIRRSLAAGQTAPAGAKADAAASLMKVLLFKID